MPPLSLATPPPPRDMGTPGGIDQAQKLSERLAGSALEAAVETFFVPMIIDEDSFRPEEFVVHEDPLDYQAALAHFFPQQRSITAQVTPFTPTSELERRVLRARQQGIDRMVFVGVPREYRKSDIVGLYPDQALTHFTSTLPGRGVITIPVRAYERDRLAAKARAGANFVISQLLYGEAIVDVARALVDTFQRPPELILSFGYVPSIEADHGLIQWLIQDPHAEAEMAWVKETAGLPRDQRKQRLTTLYSNLVGAIRGLGIDPGVNFEAPYGLSASAIEAFEAMLAIYDPRDSSQ